MHKQFVLAIAVAFFSTLAVAQQPAWQPPRGHLTLALWPDQPPGPAKPNPTPETVSPGDHLVADRTILIVHDVSSPSLTLYQPKANPSGAAIVVLPGGGYNILAIDLEGTEVCDWLVSIHVACILVKYRVPDSGLPKSPAALQDAQRALRITRHHAAEWHINPQRIGVLGFSAGAHLAAAASTRYDKRSYGPIDAADGQSCRPDFAVLVYPAYLSLDDKNYAASPDLPVTAQTPPTFLVMTEDDPIHAENVLVYFRLLKNAKVPAEAHLYSEGGHGYGLRPTELPVTHWTNLVETWLRTIRSVAQLKE